MGKLTTMREANRIRSSGEAPARVLLVGELNPYGGPDSNALVPWPNNCAGHRLQSRILGLSEETYLALHRRNLCAGTWSLNEARKAAQMCMPPMFTERAEPPWRTIIMLGVKVRDAFATLPGSDYVDSFEVRPARGLSLIALPHPSGRNAASWAGDAIHRARKLLAIVEPDVPWGSLAP